jgi:hypothetical protein
LLKEEEELEDGELAGGAACASNNPGTETTPPTASRTANEHLERANGDLERKGTIDNSTLPVSLREHAGHGKEQTQE